MKKVKKMAGWLAERMRACSLGMLVFCLVFYLVGMVEVGVFVGSWFWEGDVRWEAIGLAAFCVLGGMGMYRTGVLD